MKKLVSLQFGLSILAFIILGMPMFIYGIEKSFFYNIDPDIVYVTNAILYTKSGIISYFDHPGTPTIMSIYVLLIPLRFIAKYMLHLGFIQWSYDNFINIFYYLRLTQLFLACGSLFLFLNLIKQISKSNILIFLSFFALFSFTSLPMAIAIVPENLSFFLGVVWLLFFYKFIEKRTYVLNIILVLIASLAVSNKFTNAFLLIPSLLLPLYIPKITLLQKITYIESNIAIGIEGFLIGILPMIDRLESIISWTSSLYKHSGLHGTGKASPFDSEMYISSLKTLITDNPFVFIIVILIITLGIFLIIKKRLKFYNPVLLLTLTSLVGILVFAKYPIIHYNYINLMLLIFCGIYFMTLIKNKLAMILFPFFAILFATMVNEYIVSASSKLSSTINDSKFTVIERWTPYWAADIYREQLNQNSINKI